MHRTLVVDDEQVAAADHHVGQLRLDRGEQCVLRLRGLRVERVGVHERRVHAQPRGRGVALQQGDRLGPVRHGVDASERLGSGGLRRVGGAGGHVEGLGVRLVRKDREALLEEEGAVLIAELDVRHGREGRGHRVVVAQAHQDHPVRAVRVEGVLGVPVEHGGRSRAELAQLVPGHRVQVEEQSAALLAAEREGLPEQGADQAQHRVRVPQFGAVGALLVALRGGAQRVLVYEQPADQEARVRAPGQAELGHQPPQRTRQLVGHQGGELEGSPGVQRGRGPCVLVGECGHAVALVGQEFDARDPLSRL